MRAPMISAFGSGRRPPASAAGISISRTGNWSGRRPREGYPGFLLMSRSRTTCSFSRAARARPSVSRCRPPPARVSQMARKGKVYVIDDDEAVRDSLQFLLDSADFEVSLFDSAQTF